MPSQQKQAVLVTGATGFVGRHLVPALARQGWRVRASVRHEPMSRDQVRVDPLGPATDWRAALEGVGAVVHLAARVHHANAEHAADLYQEVNTQGTLRLAECAVEAGVRGFVYLSTILVNGSCTDGRAPFRADDAFAPRGVYGRSKADAEIGLKRIADRSSMAISVIRPPLVYGSGAGGNFARLVNAVRWGLPLPIGSIDNRRAFVSVQNLVSFISNRLADDPSGFAVYPVADEEQVSTPEFVRRIAAAMHRRAHLVPLPVRLLQFALRASGRGELRDSLIGSMEIDVAPALACGWRPELSMNEALKLALSQEA